MIVYRTPTRTCPAWLEGAPDLVTAEQRDGGALWSIGPSALLGTTNNMCPIGDDIFVGVIGQPTDTPIIRRINGWAVFPVTGAAGVTLGVPMVLFRSGERAFPCPIGQDYLPHPTPWQQRLLEIATAARSEFIRAENTDSGLPVNAVARWAVELACAGSYINAATILSLGLLDDAMAQEIIMVAAFAKGVADAE